MIGFPALLLHEIRALARQRNEWSALVLFFIIIVVLLPFAIGPDPELLQRLAPGLIWLAAMLMSFLALERLFMADARDGTLDLLLLSPMPLSLIVMSKILAQIAMMLGSLLVVLFPAALMLGLPMAALPPLIVSLLLGAPVLALLGGIAAAVTIALHRNAALLTLLLAPFYIPVLIFAVEAANTYGSSTPFYFLGAMLSVLLPTAPIIISAALRQGQS